MVKSLVAVYRGWSPGLIFASLSDLSLVGSPCPSGRKERATDIKQICDIIKFSLPQLMLWMDWKKRG